jgi:hypothetical protein
MHPNQPPLFEEHTTDPKTLAARENETLENFSSKAAEQNTKYFEIVKEPENAQPFEN